MSKYQKIIKQKLYPNRTKLKLSDMEYNIPNEQDKPDTTKYKAVRLFNKLDVPEKEKVYCPVCGSLTQKWIGNRGMVDVCWNCRKIKKE